MDAANALLNGLSGEKTRWTAQLENFADTIAHLVGDVALACAFVSYCVEVQTDATSHCVDPACGWNWDEPLQLLQAPAPSASAYLPTAQLVQLWPMPAGLNWPAAQATQLPASEPPHAVWYFPAEQW